MKVAIGVPCADNVRHGIFYDALISMTKPEGSIFIASHNANIARNRNIITEGALLSECDYILYLDDDNIVERDTLARLISHELHVVSGLYVQRQIPFAPVMFDTEDEQGRCGFRTFKPNDNGLIEVVATGAGCLLVSMEVIKQLARPWWRIGQIASDSWGDDLDFCHRVRLSGYKIYVDLETPVGHVCTNIVWPNRDPETNEWETVMFQPHDDKTPVAKWPAAIKVPYLGR